MVQGVRNTRLPTASSGILNAANTIFDIGADIEQNKYVSDLAQSALNNMQVEREIDKELFNNRANPEAARVGIEKILADHNKTMLRGVTQGRAKREIRSKAPLLTAAWRSGAEKKINAQYVSNNIAALKTIATTVQNTDYTPTSLQASLLDVHSVVAASGKAAGLSEEQIANAYDEIASPAATKTMLYSPDLPEIEGGGTLEERREHWVNNPNEFSEKLGLNSAIGRPLYTAEEAARLKSDYKARKDYVKRTAKEQLIATQQETEKGFDLRFADPEQKDLPTIDEIDAAYANDEIDQTAWKGFRKLMADGPAEQDDDESKMRVNEIRKQIMDGDITARDGFDEIRKYKDKLTAATYKTLTAGLPQLYEYPAHAKPYYSYIDTFMQDAKPSSKTHFNPLGESVSERALNGNIITAILDEFQKNNPDASYNDWDKEYKRAIETIAKKEVGSWWSRWIETETSIRNLKKQSKPGSSVKQMLKDKKASENRKEPSEYKSGDRRTVNGVTYTYDGQYWTD